MILVQVVVLSIDKQDLDDKITLADVVNGTIDFLEENQGTFYSFEQLFEGNPYNPDLEDIDLDYPDEPDFEDMMEYQDRVDPNNLRSLSPEEQYKKDKSEARKNRNELESLIRRVDQIENVYDVEASKYWYGIP